MKKTLRIVAAFLFAGTAFSACSVKDDLSDTGSTGTSNFEVRLADNPATFTKVNIDIRSVMVNLTDDASNGWTTLNTNAGIYDLLTLQNGKDTLLAKGTLSAKTVKQIRFVLGTDNTVEAGSLTYPLTIPSGAESGLKINLSKDLTMPVESVVIDFDASASIHQELDGSYTLRPVLIIRTK